MPVHPLAPRARSVTLGFGVAPRVTAHEAPETTMRVFLLLAALLLAAAPAAAADSMISPLVGARCRFTDSDGAVGDFAVKRCPGPGGLQLITRATPGNVDLSFHRPNARKAEYVIGGRTLGERIEWRGTKGRAGFAPYAAMLRVVVADSPRTENWFNVLAVIRVEARTACRLAAIDEAANPDPMALARATADAVAPAFRCGKDEPRVAGVVTQWSREVIGTGPDAPTERTPTWEPVR